MNRIVKPSKRALNVAPFLAMDMLREAGNLAAAGADIVHMEVGQPSGPPPRLVAEAARKALQSGTIGYTEAKGLPALRERIAVHYTDTYGVSVDPAQVVVTTGSSGSFVLAFLAAFDAGARVALTSPGYPAYRNIFNALGIEVADIETSAADRWAPTAEAVRNLVSHGGLDGLLVASPANPTGTMLMPDTLSALADTCAENGIWFISDEIYHGLDYAVPKATALSTSPDAIVINSFSKYYCMTGWRIGWMIVPPSLVRTAEVLAQSLYISAPTLSQYAAIAAFDATEELEQRKAAYAGNRAFLLDALPGIGIKDFSPVDGAFYIYADVGRFTNDSFAFAQKMLGEIGVAVTPGADFDPHRGHRYVRMSFAGTRDEMERAVTRLKDWLK
ncbi:MAG: aminotransferase class I/II-fold pyridoxal phosphate-dependent enzyme [Rhizobiales bacterium]|nr:aminotransferase class I/II-fold pyridoxal phosphate-dependent enzyme [Hyphomicrobiales bacterium]